MKPDLDLPKSKVFRFKHFDIVFNKQEKIWWFFVDTETSMHVDNNCFYSYDMCFRAARKWMKDHQNEIYG